MFLSLGCEEELILVSDAMSDCHADRAKLSVVSCAECDLLAEPAVRYEVWFSQPLVH